MRNVLSFPDRRRVEISYGRLVRSVVIDENGIRPSLSDIGQHQFFVEAVEPDSRVVMWSGPSYDDAIRQAHELGGEFGPVYDLVIESA